MFARLLLLFTIVPIIELALLIQVGRWIGTLPTVGLVLATGLAGAWLARREGVRAWKRVQDDLSGGRMPAGSLLHGLAIFIGGAFLLTPGILTDVLGLALLVPGTRGLLLRGVRRRMQVHVMQQTGEIQARFWTHEPGGPDRPTRRDDLP